MNTFDRVRIEKNLVDSGWDYIISSDAEKIVAGSARHKAQMTILNSTPELWEVSFDKPLLNKELSREFSINRGSSSFQFEMIDTLSILFRRAAELAFALPSQAAETYKFRVSKAIQDIGDFETEVQRLVKQRVGQDTFREALMDYWGGACTVTGINVPELLRASHAKPWAKCESDEERLDVFNGFLLSANLDALFDRGLISFNERGAIIFSSRISLEQVSKVGVTGREVLRWIEPEHEEYLKWHRAHHFQC